MEKIPNHEFPPKDDSVFIERVVKAIQHEVGGQLMQNPTMSVEEIKNRAAERFMELVSTELLTQEEANKCYQRFCHMVNFYYGT